MNRNLLTVACNCSPLVFNLFSVVSVSRSNVVFSVACVVLFHVFSVLCVVMFAVFTVSGVVIKLHLNRGEDS